MSGGSLAALVQKFGRFSESIIRRYTRQILDGLNYLHQHGIIHRDIKGGNILVDSNGIVKVADFGAAKQIQNVLTVTEGFKSLTGTPYWMAPEVIRQTGHGRQADIWSLGCTVIEMATGKPPWSQFSTHVSAMFHIAMATEPPDIPDHLSDDAKDFLYLCLKRNPRERPNASKLLEHPFVSDAYQSTPNPSQMPYISPPGSATVSARDSSFLNASSPPGSALSSGRSVCSPSMTAATAAAAAIEAELAAAASTLVPPVEGTAVQPGRAADTGGGAGAAAGLVDSYFAKADGEDTLGSDPTSTVRRRSSPLSAELHQQLQRAQAEPQPNSELRRELYRKALASGEPVNLPLPPLPPDAHPVASRPYIAEAAVSADLRGSDRDPLPHRPPLPRVAASPASATSTRPSLTSTTLSVSGGTTSKQQARPQPTPSTTTTTTTTLSTASTANASAGTYRNVPAGSSSTAASWYGSQAFSLNAGSTTGNTGTFPSGAAGAGGAATIAFPASQSQTSPFRAAGSGPSSPTQAGPPLAGSNPMQAFATIVRHASGSTSSMESTVSSSPHGPPRLLPHANGRSPTDTATSDKNRLSAHPHTQSHSGTSAQMRSPSRSQESPSSSPGSGSKQVHSPFEVDRSAASVNSSPPHSPNPVTVLSASPRIVPTLDPVPTKSGRSAQPSPPTGATSATSHSHHPQPHAHSHSHSHSHSPSPHTQGDVRDYDALSTLRSLMDAKPSKHPSSAGSASSTASPSHAEGFPVERRGSSSSLKPLSPPSPSFRLAETQHASLPQHVRSQSGSETFTEETLRKFLEQGVTGAGAGVSTGGVSMASLSLANGRAGLLSPVAEKPKNTGSGMSTIGGDLASTMAATMSVLSTRGGGPGTAGSSQSAFRSVSDYVSDVPVGSESPAIAENHSPRLRLRDRAAVYTLPGTKDDSRSKRSSKPTSTQSHSVSGRPGRSVSAGDASVLNYASASHAHAQPRQAVSRTPPLVPSSTLAPLNHSPTLPSPDLLASHTRMGSSSSGGTGGGAGGAGGVRGNGGTHDNTPVSGTGPGSIETAIARAERLAETRRAEMQQKRRERDKAAFEMEMENYRREVAMEQHGKKRESGLGPLDY
eukprot:Rmarinus@m.12533